MKNTLFLAFTFLFLTPSDAQEPVISVLTSGKATSLRGLSVVNDNVLWVSGSNGVVGRSTNAGKNWKWTVVRGFEKTEFRDIEAFDANVAIIMAVGEPAYILKTSDGGDTWKIVFENKMKGMFLDAMDFANNQEGMVVGDPIDGKVFMAVTRNSGNTWEQLSDAPKADSGEAFFAASGSNIRFFADDDEFLLVSGGMASNLFTKELKSPLPIMKGTESAGANAIDVYDNGNPDKPSKKIIIVGGDFSHPYSDSGNCIYSKDGGDKWKVPKTPPHGYRSSVEYLSNKVVISCGTNGVDLSTDGGKNWTLISKEGFNTCRIARIGTAVYLAGNKGKVARFILP